MPSPAAHCSFDDIVVDFAGHRLLRGGVEQPLEPKAFGVLALLVGSPGQVFDRDEILDAVWGHRHVTPGVLNRVMTLLRQALGEDAHHPRLLQTVHGVGYRFDLPPPAPSDESAPALENPAVPARSEPAPAPVEISHAPMLATSRLQPVLFLLLALAGIGAASAWWLRETPPSPAPSTPSSVSTQSAIPTLVVMPLKPIGSGDSVKVIADGLGEELIYSLAQIEGLRVIAHESTTIAAAESIAPAVLAKRLGISHALEGSLQQAGQRLRIRLRLVDAKTGSMLWVKDFDRDASEVLALQLEIAKAVATSLTLKLGLITTPKKSGDAEFLRRLLAAKALARTIGVPPDASVEPAETEFRALLRERPEDSRAQAGLALALAIRSWRRPELGARLREEAMQSARLAVQMDPTLPEPHLILASEDCRLNRWDVCMARIAEAKALSPNLSLPYLDTARSWAQLGYLDRAETEARKGLARDPLSSGAHFSLARILDTQGRHHEAQAQFAHTNAGGVYGRWFNAMLRRDYADALRIAETYDTPNASDYYGRLLKPSTLLTTRAMTDPSLWPQAMDSMRQWEQGNLGRMAFGRVFAPDAQAHATKLVAGLAQARKRAYSSYDLLLWTKDLAFLRRDPAFQAYLRDNGILAYWKKHGFPKQCRPQGDGAACE